MSSASTKILVDEIVDVCKKFEDTCALSKGDRTQTDEKQIAGACVKIAGTCAQTMGTNIQKNKNEIASVCSLSKGKNIRKKAVTCSQLMGQHTQERFTEIAGVCSQSMGTIKRQIADTCALSKGNHNPEKVCQITGGCSQSMGLNAQQNNCVKTTEDCLKIKRKIAVQKSVVLNIASGKLGAPTILTMSTVHPNKASDQLAAAGIVHLMAKTPLAWTPEDMDTVLTTEISSSVLTDPSTAMCVSHVPYTLTILPKSEFEDYTSIVNALETMMKLYSTCLLCLAKTTLAVLFVADAYYVFDPQPRLANGRIRIKSGFACLYECSSINQVGILVNQANCRVSRKKLTTFTLLPCIVVNDDVTSSPKQAISDLKRCYDNEIVFTDPPQRKRYTPSPSAFEDHARPTKFPSCQYGSHCQADARFSRASANNQCTAMAVFFICYTYVRDPNTFDASVIDAILMNGDHLYKESYKQQTAAQQKVSRYLNYGDVLTKVDMMFTVDVRCGYFDVEYRFENQLEGTVKSLWKLIVTFFELGRTHGVVTASNLSYGIVFQSGLYYLFDSHANTVQKVAVLVRCSSAAQLADEIMVRLVNVANSNTPATIGDIGCGGLIPTSSDALIPVVAVTEDTGTIQKRAICIRPCTSKLPTPKAALAKAAVKCEDMNVPRRSTRIRSASSDSNASEKSVVKQRTEAQTPLRRSTRIRLMSAGSVSSEEKIPPQVSAPEKSLKIRRTSSSLFSRARTFRRALEYGLHEINYSSIGGCDNVCVNCEALHFTSELPCDKVMSLCCDKGRTNFSYAMNYPAVLCDYMSHATPISRFFMANILRINNHMAFAAMETNICTPQSAFAVSRGNTPEVIKVNGMITHLVHHLTERAAFVAGHTYMFETKDAVRHRIQNLKPERSADVRMYKAVFTCLDKFFRKNNPFVAMYRMLKDVENERQAKIARGEDVDNSIHLEILNDRRAMKGNRGTEAEGCLKGRYTLPTHNQVCIVTSDFATTAPGKRNIYVYPSVKAGREPARKVPFINPNRSPMMYPLLFPYGEQGWGWGLQKRSMQKHPAKNMTLSHREWAAYVLQARADKPFNPFLHAGKLSNMWAIDTQMAIESQFIEYIRTNQTQLNSDNYNALSDYVSKHKNDQGEIPGKIIVLPSSFTLGERHRKKNFHDSMALSAKFGKPSLFITMTCNMSWPEITAQLRPLERAEHRPDVLCRVFKIKHDELINRIDKGHYFGRCLAYSRTIEFQKRGWPHAHMLVWIDERDLRLDDPDDIDSVVWARIPDSAADPELFELMKKMHIHGPCGALNPSYGCMVDGKCSKKYPFDFLNATVPNKNGHPLYKRPNDGVGICFAPGRVADNRFVVPYNPTLLREFNCHLNVEVVKSIASIKYLHKYVNKGCDQAACSQNYFVREKDGTLVYDETAAYLHTRYMCAVEAMWHLFEFRISVMSHTVYLLMLHLPGMQNIKFKMNELNEAIRTGEKTMLTEYFQLNARDENARKFLYKDIPQHYVFHNYPAENRRWTKRKQRGNKTLSRMYYVDPKQSDLFALRLLLLHVRGATSFEKLRTIHGTVYTSFPEAAMALGLLQSDKVWSNTMSEAAHVRMPIALRQLFVTICCLSGCSDPLSLYTEFKESMSEDFTRRGISEIEASDRMLIELERLFRINGKTLEEFRLPLPQVRHAQLIDCDDIVLLNACIDIEQFDRQVASLNNGQRSAYNSIKAALDQASNPNAQRLFFIDGFGGSGKTYLYDTLIRMCERLDYKSVATASTGIAASLLKNGRTLHSIFKFPIGPIEMHTTCNVKRQSKDAARLRECDLIIWDEVSMCNGRMLDAVDELMRELMCSALPFGGKIVVVGGDFRQCLPIIPGASKTQLLHAIAKNSNVWQHFRPLKLSANMRLAEEDVCFLEWQLAIGEGRLVDAAGTEYYPELVKIPPEMLVYAEESDVSELLDRTYGKEFTPYQLDTMSDRMVLTTLNVDVDRINKLCLSRLREKKSTLRTYFSEDSAHRPNEDATDDDFNAFPVEVLNQEMPSGFPLHALTLTVNSPILLLKNINPAAGLCNGTRLKVMNLRPNLIQAMITTGVHKGSQVLIPKVNMIDTSNPHFTLTRVQFPVKLNFAMTIHKCQGQTFENVSLFLQRPVFSHGQLYVAVSRVRQKKNLVIQICDSKVQGRNQLGTFTPNVVYREVFD